MWEGFVPSVHLGLSSSRLRWHNSSLSPCMDVIIPFGLFFALVVDCTSYCDCILMLFKWIISPDFCSFGLFHKSPRQRRCHVALHACVGFWLQEADGLVQLILLFQLLAGKMIWKISSSSARHVKLLFLLTVDYNNIITIINTFASQGVKYRHHIVRQHCVSCFIHFF